MRVFPISISVAAVSMLVQIAGAQAVRVLEDVSTGDRWVLERDRAHPAGPGRLVLQENGTKPAGEKRGVKVKPSPMIHGGDRVVVVEKTEAVQARLQGVALASAGRGELVKVRLTVGGWLVRGIAEAPGQVRLVGEAR